VLNILIVKHLNRLLNPSVWSISAKLSAALLLASIAPMSFTAYCRQYSTSMLVVAGITTIVALFLARMITRPIRTLTAAAQTLGHGDFDASALDVNDTLIKDSQTKDDIGQLVRVFLAMSEQVRLRNQKLKTQVQELRIEIDENKKVHQVADITENEYFQQLQQKIQKLRKQSISVAETESQYYERLQNKVQSLKKRSLY
jgi:methyl-accepting chemotaxis protein